MVMTPNYALERSVRALSVRAAVAQTIIAPAAPRAARSTRTLDGMFKTPILRPLGLEPSTQRQAFLLIYKALSEAIGAVEATSGKFVLLLAGDFTRSDLPLGELAERIVRSGC